MTESATPRWLKLAMAPILAGAAFCIDFEIQSRFADNLFANDFDDASTLLVGVGQLVGPLASACVIAYPLARLYDEDWKLACLGVLLPIVLFYACTYFDPGDLLGTFTMMLHGLVFAFFVPGLAALARFPVRGSHLVVVPVGDAGDRNPGTVALTIVLLPAFAIAMFIIRDYWQPLVQDIGFLPTTRTGDRVGLMLASVIGPAALALAFAFPIARIYGRQALLVGGLVPLLTLGWNSRLLEQYGLPFVGASYAVELAMLATLPALLAWWAARWFRDSCLAIRED